MALCAPRSPTARLVLAMVVLACSAGSVAAAQRRMAIRLELGAQPALCAVVASKSYGTPFPAISDHAGRFDGVKGAPAPVQCPQFP